MNPKIKIGASICVYNDYEFLAQAIDGISPYLDKLFIVEGAWQTAIDSGANKRSNEKTLDIIKSRVSRDVIYCPANKANESQQRQYAVDLHKENNIDFCICPDADEIFKPDTIKSVINKITDIYHKEEYYGVKLCSYNFFGNLNQYYDGEYPRGYRVTDDLTCYETNHFYWPNHNRGIDNYISLNEDQDKFYHYSYLRKNTELFHIKMKFLEKEFGSNLYSKGYGEKDGIYNIPIDNFHIFTGEHPKIIQNTLKNYGN